MGNKNISETLMALATSTDSKDRFATERLRDIFDDVEIALRARVRRKVVYQALKEDGLDMSFASFELAVYRIRKERSEQQTVVPVAPAAKVAASSYANGEVVAVKPPGMTQAAWIAVQAKTRKS